MNATFYTIPIRKQKDINLNNKLLCTLTDNYKHKGDCECTNKCLEIRNYLQLYDTTILPGC